MSQSFTYKGHDLIMGDYVSNEAREHVKELLESEGKWVGNPDCGVNYLETFQGVSEKWGCKIGGTVTVKGSSGYDGEYTLTSTHTLTPLPEISWVAQPESDDTYQSVHGSHGGMSFPTNKRGRR